MPNRKTRNRNKPAALFLVLLAAPALGAASLPPATELLDKALNPPDIAFEGRMMVTHWFGKQTRAVEVEVHHAPGGRIRREYLSPDGTVERVIVSDGDREEIRLLKQKKVIHGDAVRSTDKLMSPDAERDLLLKNYSLSVVKADKVAGRSSWILEFKPIASGKPYQRLWIDQQTGVILENKRYLPKRSFAALSRYSRFEPQKEIDGKLFELELSTRSIPGKGLEPDFFSVEELNQATGKQSNFPPELPGGFVFESADFFEIGKHTVRHARYTDGLAVLSLFQTDRPVSLPKDGSVAMPRSQEGPGTLRLSSSGKVLNWKRGRQYYTLMGDVSREILQGISARLKQ